MFTLLVSLFPCLLVLLLALVFRLLVLRWREPYPLGGDETEYLNQALTLLRDRQYVELRLMRPPLYTAFLAGSIYLFDSAVQNLRLVQAFIGALTVVPLYALAWELFRSRRVALIAGLLFALNYTLAAAATELLTETVFLFGLTVALWLLTKAETRRQEDKKTGRQEDKWSFLSSCLLVFLAGLTLGALTLVRSVALPLVGIGALWLLLNSEFRILNSEFRKFLAGLILPIVLVASACVVILPWTIRNYVVYGAPILVDTTGAENLWLDNNPSAATPADPLGREAAKAQLYALGDDRAARQSLASSRGIEEITQNPGWFVQKMWGEAKKFFALQYFDELREKRAIWLPLTEVWAKLLLGDGIWLLLLFGGLLGWTIGASQVVHRTSKIVHIRWLFIAWALYILITSMIFHVELRYRLPVYPVLAPFAAFAIGRPRRQEGKKAKETTHLLVFLSSCLLVSFLTLLHRSYPTEAWMLANKHAALWRAEQALSRNNGAEAQQSAFAALGWDDSSALARVALARAAILRGDRTGAEAALDDAIKALDAHPQAHLLRGALLRQDGKEAEARSELAFETGSLQDLQAWSWRVFRPLAQPPTELAIGSGLDLGFIQGFHPAETGFRWTKAEARVEIRVTPGANTLVLEVAPGRPAGAAAAHLRVFDGSTEIGNVQLRDGWQTVSLPLKTAQSVVGFVLRADTFRPRDFDRTSADNRELGVMVRQAATVVAR